MITKNPMQLKAIIKKKSMEKHISPQLVITELHAGKTLGTYFVIKI